MSSDLVEARYVVELWDEPWNRCHWARLNNGLEVQITVRDIIDRGGLPRAEPRHEDRGSWLVAINPLRQAEIILGLPGIN